MQRRTFLATTATALGATTGLAGCVGDRDDGGSGGNGTTTPTTRTTTEPGTDDSGLAVVGVEADSAPALPVEPTVEVLTPSATPETPVRLRIAWENTGSEPVTLGESRQVVFTLATSVDGAAQLVAGDMEFLQEGSVFDDCWQLTDGIGMDSSYQTVELDPGEVHTGESALFAAETCLDDGTYRFETEAAIGDAGDPSETADWGFDLTVETPA